MIVVIISNTYVENERHKITISLNNTFVVVSWLKEGCKIKGNYCCRWVKSNIDNGRCSDNDTVVRLVTLHVKMTFRKRTDETGEQI